MKIIVGSENPTKIKAVQEVFLGFKVHSIDIPSLVSPQPFSDEETIQGAINRARQCAEIDGSDCGIGLEGGVMSIGEQLYLCNWGALVTPHDEIYTAGGARILLPAEIRIHLERGLELGEVMEHYAKKKGVSKREGAIGILTNNYISRKEMFVHIVQLLKGQWEY